jgi:hypothetical protein
MKQPSSSRTPRTKQPSTSKQEKSPQPPSLPSSGLTPNKQAASRILSSIIVNNTNYDRLKLVVLEEGFAKGYSERADAMRCGMNETFEIFERLALQIEEGKEYSVPSGEPDEDGF